MNALRTTNMENLFAVRWCSKSIILGSQFLLHLYLKLSYMTDCEQWKKNCRYI